MIKARKRTIATDGTEESHISTRNMAASTWCVPEVICRNINDRIDIPWSRSLRKRVIHRIDVK
jgi:hypothetical protein